MIATAANCKVEAGSGLTACLGIRYGISGTEVRQLQQLLQDLNLFKWKISGSYDIQTEYAVKKYQQAEKLAITGTITLETLSALQRTENEMLLQEINGEQIHLEEGETGKYACMINHLLYKLGYGVQPGEASFNMQTAAAIRQYQKDEKLKITGTLNGETVKRLYISEVSRSPSMLVPMTGEKSPSKSLQSVILQHALIMEKLPADSQAKSISCTFIREVYKKAGIILAGCAHQLWHTTKSLTVPSIGDLVFAGPLHKQQMGLYTGNKQYITVSEAGIVQKLLQPHMAVRRPYSQYLKRCIPLR